jgi:hypothetical protein
VPTPVFSFAKLVGTLRFAHPNLRNFTKNRHTPRMRGIQYAAASRFYYRRLWNTGSPAFAGDDSRKRNGFNYQTAQQHSRNEFALAARSARGLL